MKAFEKSTFFQFKIYERPTFFGQNGTLRVMGLDSGRRLPIDNFIEYPKVTRRGYYLVFYSQFKHV